MGCFSGLAAAALALSNGAQPLWAAPASSPHSGRHKSEKYKNTKKIQKMQKLYTRTQDMDAHQIPTECHTNLKTEFRSLET